jgi:hypothetical protein
VNFEDRCEIDAAGRTLVSVPWDIEPGMINTWPASRRQSKLELCTLIADEINCGLIPREEREEYAAKEYAENLDFVSVRELLGDLKSGAAEHFKNEIESRRLQIRQRHSDILKCADALQTERNDISQALLEFESLLDEARLQEAEEWMLVIEDSIRLHKEAQDPERVDIIDRLAALEFDGTSYSLLELRNEWKTAQDAYLNQRLHIDAILRSANATGFPEWLQSSWVELVATLDHPRFWPSAENSYYLQETIPLISRYITGKNRHLDDSTRRHIESVSNCVMAVLRGLMKPESTLATSVLAELEHMIREMHPERAIAAFIAKQSADTFDETASLKAVLPEKRVIVTESQRLPRTNMTLTQVAKDDFKQQTRQFILQWRETLVDLIKRDSAIRAVSRDALGKLIEKRSWLLARRAVAEFLVAEHERLPEQITEYEATYAICCLMTDYFGSPEALKQCCIVAASVPAPFGISTVHVIPRVLIFALGVEADSERVRDEDLGAAVGKSLNTFAKMGRQEIPWRWCHSLLVSADRLRCNAICPTTQIIDDIWDVLKSVTETVEFRRDLLTVLFGMQRRELLLHLTKRLDARLSGPASRLVNSFISIDHESDEDSKKQVIQSVFLFESSQGGARNTRPWGAFFKQQLHRIVQAKDEIPIQIRLESDKLYIDDVGNVLLEFVLSPLGAATVESLTLHLGGIENDNQSAHEEVLVEASDPLQTECARRVQFPATLLVPEGTNMLVAYRFLGHERYSNEEFSLSGRWQVKLAQNRPSPLDDNELQLGWPGAQGKTVRSGTGFYGRKKELGDLDAWLIRSPTPQSVMIFGQRRIGKSSLLEEQVSSMPAVKGHMCGIYCSIDAMPVDGDLGVEFFRQVVQSLSASNINESVREKIQGKVDRLLDVDRLTRVCRPEIKIAEAFEKLLDVLLSMFVLSRPSVGDAQSKWPRINRRFRERLADPLGLSKIAKRVCVDDLGLIV